MQIAKVSFVLVGCIVCLAVCQEDSQQSAAAVTASASGSDLQGQETNAKLLGLFGNNYPYQNGYNGYNRGPYNGYNGYNYNGYGGYNNGYGGGYNGYNAGGYGGYNGGGYGGYYQGSNQLGGFGGYGGYGGYSGNGGLPSYLGYYDQDYQGHRNLGYGYYRGTDAFGFLRPREPIPRVNGFRGYD